MRIENGTQLYANNIILTVTSIVLTFSDGKVRATVWVRKPSGEVVSLSGETIEQLHSEGYMEVL